MFTYKPLWKLLINKNMNYTEFAHTCNISSTTLYKMRKDKYIDMQSLNKVCSNLQCKIEDIIEYIPDT